jgi:tetratricopeptide (TPR) repeat protein
MAKHLLAVLVWCAVAVPAAAQRAHTEAPLDSLVRWARRDSLDARAQFDLGMGRWKDRQYLLADSAFRRALELKPHYAEPRLALAWLPLSRGERYFRELRVRQGFDTIIGVIRASSKLYREAYLLDPLVDPTILGSVDIDVLVPRVNKVEVANGKVFSRGVPWWEGRTKRGVKALTEGRYDEAFASLDAVVESRQVQEGANLPDEVVWYYGLAAAHAGKHARAAAAFHELADRAARREEYLSQWIIPTDRADYLFLYAAMSEQAGNVGMAVQQFGEALAADFGLYSAHSRLADIHEGRGDVEGAIAERQRAVDTSPEIGKLELDLAVTLLQAGRPLAAESAFVRAARLLPDDAGAHQFLATVARQNGHPEVERTALERFIVVAPYRYAELVAEARRRVAELP